MKKRILAIIPAYNEEKNIASTIASIQTTKLPVDILVIDDGSTDNTAAVVSGIKNVNLITLPCNLGIGGAVQTGFKFAYRNSYYCAFQFDGDGQHNAHDIERLIQPVLAGTADMIIGSRFLASNDGFKSTFMRRIGIRYFMLLNLLLIGKKITDNTSGFRAYSREALAFLAEHYPADYPEPEAVITMSRNRFRILEIPVVMSERQGGVSSINGLRSMYYMIKVTLGILFSRFRKSQRKR